MSMLDQRRATVTGAQRREMVMTFIRAYCAGHAHGPTVREIMDGVGLSSTSAANHHIQILKTSGKLIGGEQPRTLHPAPGHRRPPAQCPTCARAFTSGSGS